MMMRSFQRPSGGLTVPMNGISTHWFTALWSMFGITVIIELFLTGFLPTLDARFSGFSR